jgi:hypothetical protein
MPKHRTHLLLCTLALFRATSARAQQIPAAIEMDPPDKLHNHAMVEALRKAGNSYVAEIHMETDHSYSDHRIAFRPRS